MKSKTFFTLLILVFAILIIALSCATNKIADRSKDYELYGTWVNPDYNKWSHMPGKIEFHPDGKLFVYNGDTDTMYMAQGQFAIINKWTDSEGNTWYKIKVVDVPWGTEYGLIKIGNSGMTLEYIWSIDDYPKEMDPDNPLYKYRIWNRQ